MDKSINQQLDQKLRESYQQFSVPAPDGIWEQLQTHLPEPSLEQQLDDKVQASYEAQAATAPEGVWEQLEKNLPAAVDEQLDDKIKQGFTEHVAKAAPLAAWSVIAEELNNTAASLDEQLDDKVKQSYQEEQLLAPQKVWAAVNRQLNIDRTWKRISAALDAPVVAFDWKLRSLQGLVLALLLLLWFRTCNKVPTVIPSAPMAAKTKQEKNPAQIINKALSLLESEKNTKNTPKENVLSSTPAPSHKGNQKITTIKVSEAQNTPLQQGEPSTAGTIKKPQESNKLNQLQLQQKKSQNQDNQTNQGTRSDYQSSNKTITAIKPIKVREATIPQELTLVQEPNWKKKPWLFKNRLAFGVFTAVNSTVLLNNETRQSFDYNSLTINYFGLAANYGLWGRYQWHKKGAIVAEYSLNADHRQAYGIYQKGQFVIKEYVFNYNRISLAYQLDLWQDPQHASHKITAQLGGYAGIRRGFQLYYDKVLVNDKLGDYHQYDAGLKVALGHEFIIDHFVIGYGIRSDIGLANVFRGNKQLNAQQNRTNLIHLGGYIQLGYQF
jgi:hypothetical protein